MPSVLLLGDVRTVTGGGFYEDGGTEDKVGRVAKPVDGTGRMPVVHAPGRSSK